MAKQDKHSIHLRLTPAYVKFLEGKRKMGYSIQGYIWHILESHPEFKDFKK